ncbi:MAG: hypothetical protein FJ316_08555 [SAR202 cluster bacterium]|nr:hypothetical protein [SAR202 cluster bacterium]
MPHPSLTTAARRILLTNLRQGVAPWNGKPYSFVCPSLRSYPFQWFWDSCFHAIALLHLDTVQARAELTTLLSAAQPDGLIPHLVFWEMEKQPQFLRRNLVGQTSPHFSSTIQPPIIAYAVERVCQATGDEAFKQAALPPLMAYYRWLRRVRDPDADGLIAILQPEESGVDCSPKYDDLLGLEELTNSGFIAALKKVYADYAPLRPSGEGLRSDDRAILALDRFHVEDVMVNSIYAQGLRALARLLGDAPESAEFSAQAVKTRDALLNKCWDEESGAFFDLAGVAERPVKVVTISSLMPLVLEDLPQPVVRRLVEQWVTAPEHFWTPYPLPSVPASDPKFLPGDPRGFIWRGPTWINTNWFLSRALRQRGYLELANTIVARSQELVSKSGFREYYHPYTGEGLGARDFGWSTLVLDM